MLANRGDVRTEAIEREMARRLLGLPRSSFAAQRLPADLPRQVRGTYDIGVFPIVVAEREGGLWLQMPPPGPTTALRYLGGRAFASETEPDAYRIDFGEGPNPDEPR